MNFLLISTGFVSPPSATEVFHDGRYLGFGSYFAMPAAKFIFGSDLRLLNGILFGFLNNFLILPKEKGKRLFKPADCPFVISQINLS